MRVCVQCVQALTQRLDAREAQQCALQAQMDAAGTEVQRSRAETKVCGCGCVGVGVRAWRWMHFVGVGALTTMPGAFL